MEVFFHAWLPGPGLGVAPSTGGDCGDGGGGERGTLEAGYVLEAATDGGRPAGEGGRGGGEAHALPLKKRPAN